MYHERSLMVYELYIATISCVVAAIVFGIISAMLAIVNTGSNPVEAICHVPGLYLWNGLALFASVAAFVTWIVQYYHHQHCFKGPIQDKKGKTSQCSPWKASWRHNVVLKFLIFVLVYQELVIRVATKGMNIKNSSLFLIG